MLFRIICFVVFGILNDILAYLDQNTPGHTHPGFISLLLLLLMLLEVVQAIVAAALAVAVVVAVAAIVTNIHLLSIVGDIIFNPDSMFWRMAKISKTRTSLVNQCRTSVLTNRKSSMHVKAGRIELAESTCQTVAHMVTHGEVLSTHGQLTLTGKV